MNIIFSSSSFRLHFLFPLLLTSLISDLADGGIEPVSKVEVLRGDNEANFFARSSFST